MALDNTYLLLDSRNMLLAKGILLNAVSDPTWQIRILDDRISTVMKREDVRLFGVGEGTPVLMGRILQNRDDIVILQRLQRLGSEVRTNFRTPVDFKSFIYPLTGSWKGRREIEGNDMSCGGIAFYCSEELQEGEEVEVVIPLTRQPLVVRCQVLRHRPSDRKDVLYATRFVDICYDEEMLLREAVFSAQPRDLLETDILKRNDTGGHVYGVE